MSGNLFENSIETPKEQIDNKLVNFLRNRLLVGIPAKVTNISEYETKQVVDVVPVIDDVLIDGREIKAPTLTSIFVKLPAGGGVAIKLPIAVGDLVTLHYSHKDISNWLDGDGSNLAQSTSRIAQKRDCWVTHGFGTRNSNQSPSATDYVVEAPNTTITITPDGKYILSTNAEIEVTTTSTATVNATSATVNANTQINGNLGVSGTITAPNGAFSDSLQVDNKELKDHTHGGVTSGSADTGPNNPSPP